MKKWGGGVEGEARRTIYRWHDAAHPSPPTWFDKLLDKIQHQSERAWNAFRNFLRKLWPRGLNLSPGKEKKGPWKLKVLRLWLALIAVLTIRAGVVLFWLWRRREAVSPPFLSLLTAPLSHPDDQRI